MKRKTIYAAIIGAILLFFPSPIFAQEAGEEEIEFNLQGGDDTPGGTQNPKTPILVPTAWLNGHVVDFQGVSNAAVYDLQGHALANKTVWKDIYVQKGKKYTK